MDLTSYRYSILVPWLTSIFSDDGILTSLGNPAEFTGEQRQQFCKGLKKVLTDLRARKVRDFDVIAKEIIAHRAQFLGDPLSILNIDVDSD